MGFGLGYDDAPLQRDQIPQPKKCCGYDGKLNLVGRP